MSEWFTLVALLSAAACAARAMWPRLSVRTDLRLAVDQQRLVPLTDASGAPITVVARSLALQEADLPPPPVPERVVVPWRRGRAAAAYDVRLMIRPLGLELVDVIRTHDPLFGPGRVLGGRTEMAGFRHGREVRVRIEEGSSDVWINGAFGAFQVTPESAEWSGRDVAPVCVAALLDTIAPHARWRGAEILGGPDGVVLRRERSATGSWMHDLWLAERFADAAAGSIAGSGPRLA